MNVIRVNGNDIWLELTKNSFKKATTIVCGLMNVDEITAYSFLTCDVNASTLVVVLKEKEQVDQFLLMI